MRTYPCTPRDTRDRNIIRHTACAKMSYEEILDLTAVVAVVYFRSHLVLGLCCCCLFFILVLLICWYLYGSGPAMFSRPVYFAFSSSSSSAAMIAAAIHHTRYALVCFCSSTHILCRTKRQLAVTLPFNRFPCMLVLLCVLHFNPAPDIAVKNDLQKRVSYLILRRWNPYTDPAPVWHPDPTLT